MALNFRNKLLTKTTQKVKNFTNLPFIWNNYDKSGVRSNMNFAHDKAFINNQWVTGNTDKKFEVINPATEEVVGVVPDLNVDDMKTAIQAAHEAFPLWSTISANDRAKILLKIQSRLRENKSELAKIITNETGKPIAESMTEIKNSTTFLEWFAEGAKRLQGDVYSSPLKDRMMLSIKQPIGVIGFLTTWNFPLAVILRKMSAALAVGCTCVLKPSEFTPLTALAFADIAEKSGLPKGVLNVVTCSTENAPPVSKLLCESETIAGLSFTGSTEIGKIVYNQCSSTVKKIMLELGGNAPFIVFDNANIRDAVDGAIASKFRNCGQTCVSANRFFIQEKVYDTFLQQMKTRMNSLQLGDGRIPQVNLGPLGNLNQVKRIDAFVKDAINKGAELLQGGKNPKGESKYFYEPTLLSGVKPNMLCYQEEIFGPVVACIKFKTENEVMAMSNDSRKGLAGYFYTNNLHQIFRVAAQLEVGMVGVNAGHISAEHAPFGGVKESGIGREGSYHGLEEFVNIKYICIGNIWY